MDGGQQGKSFILEIGRLRKNTGLTQDPYDFSVRLTISNSLKPMYNLKIQNYWFVESFSMKYYQSNFAFAGHSVNDVCVKTPGVVYWRLGRLWLTYVTMTITTDLLEELSLSHWDIPHGNVYDVLQFNKC